MSVVTLNAATGSATSQNLTSAPAAANNTISAAATGVASATHAICWHCVEYGLAAGVVIWGLGKAYKILFVAGDKHKL